ncbi:MAG: hypothetical protein WAO98_09130 [Alphaproteobacteria bacterium]
MCGELNRYFIELMPDEGGDIPRYRENEIRRELATNFLAKIAEWLTQNELKDKVATVAVTALGQVQITCEPDVISQMRSHEALNIAAIRQSGMYIDNASRWNQAH